MILAISDLTWRAIAPHYHVQLSDAEGPASVGVSLCIRARNPRSASLRGGRRTVWSQHLKLSTLDFALGRRLTAIQYAKRATMPIAPRKPTSCHNISYPPYIASLPFDIRRRDRHQVSTQQQGKRRLAGKSSPQLAPAMGQKTILRRQFFSWSANPALFLRLRC